MYTETHAGRHESGCRCSLHSPPSSLQSGLSAHFKLGVRQPVRPSSGDDVTRRRGFGNLRRQRFKRSVATGIVDHVRRLSESPYGQRNELVGLSETIRTMT